LLPQLTSLVEWHITEYNITEFVVGRHGNFDSLAARAVITAKTASTCAVGLPAPIPPCGAERESSERL